VVPERVSFGEERVGTKSQASALTLSNPGPGPLRIESLLTSGIDFSETDDCGYTVHDPGFLSARHDRATPRPTQRYRLRAGATAIHTAFGYRALTFVGRTSCRSEAASHPVACLGRALWE
jgi:hypothetical protein